MRAATKAKKCSDNQNVAVTFHPNLPTLHSNLLQTKNLGSVTQDSISGGWLLVKLTLGFVHVAMAGRVVHVSLSNTHHDRVVYCSAVSSHMAHLSCNCEPHCRPHHPVKCKNHSGMPASQSTA